MRPSFWDTLSAGQGTNHLPLQVTVRTWGWPARCWIQLPHSLCCTFVLHQYILYSLVMGRNWTPRQKVETSIQLFKLEDLQVGTSMLVRQNIQSIGNKNQLLLLFLFYFLSHSQPHHHHHHCNHQGLNSIDLLCKFSRGPAIVPKWKWPQRKRHTPWFSPKLSKNQVMDLAIFQDRD